MSHESLSGKQSYLRIISLLSNICRHASWLPLLIVYVAGVSCDAQDYSSQTGSPTFSANQPVPYGFVNLANGNVHVEIPVASAPQRGKLAFAAKLVYDSRIWQIVHAGGSLVWKPNNLPLSISGWRFVTNATPGTVNFDATQVTKGCNDIDNPTVINFVNFVWMSPDGTPRKFPVATAQDPGCPDDVSSADGFAVDSSGYHMYVTNYSTVIIYARDGTQVYPRVEDANGNYFTTDANGNVIDTLGRTVVQQSTSGNQTFYDVLNSQGTTSRITVTTKQILVRTLFLQPGVSEDQESITVLDRVSLPDGEAYSFGYDAGVITDPSTGAFQPGYGLLTGVSPGGGYTYKNFVDPFGIVNRWAASTIDSSIEYLANPGIVQATLSRNGGTEAFGFTLNNGAWLTTATTRIGSHQVQQISNTYDFTQTCPNPFINVILNPCIGPAYIRLLKSVTSDDVGSKQTTYGYDDPRFGNVDLIQNWNYFPLFGTPPATPDRKTVITMHPVIGQNILDRVQSVVLTDGAGNPLSQTNYSYDDVGLTTPTHAVFNNDTSLGTSRGNLTQVSRWAGGTTFLTAQFTYDTAGQVLSFKDAAGNVTKLDYTDNFFNDAGVGQTFGAHNANPPAATDAYPTTVTLPIGKVTLGYYYGSGKQAFAIDQNGQQTAQHFADPLDRLSHTVGPKGWVQIAYASLFSYDIFTGLNDTQPSISCTSCIHLTNFLDLQGRVISSTLASDPDGAATSTALYDIMGNTLTASNPTRTGIGASTSNSYDVLYRLTKSQNPDNSVGQVFYGIDVTAAGGLSTQLCPSATYGTGFPILGINEVGLKSQVWVDGFGRTIETDEPDAANVLSVATCNQYNLAGELTQVAQGNLTRSYRYDPLWRVTQITMPEAGTETFSYVNDDGTLCSGDPSNPCKRIDARGIATRYQYDALNRLTKTTYSDSTPSAFFNYDEASALGIALTNTAGRPSSIFTKDGTGKILTGEIFSYDPSGSVINNSQCTPQNCGAGVFQNTYTTDQMGNVLNFDNSWGRGVGAKLNNAGQVTTMTVGGSDATHPGTLLSNAKYNQFGEMTLATLGNGLTEAMDYSGARGWLESMRIGTLAAANSPGGNVAMPGQGVVTLQGILRQASGASAGRASLTISGGERSISSGPGTPGTGSLTINGQDQLKQVAEIPAVGGTGTVTINGGVQSTQIITQPAASGTGSFTMGGVLQTKAATAAVGATGSVTISGSEHATNVSVSITVAGSGFETPALGSGANAYQYHPTGSSWTFGPNSGSDSNNNIVGGSGITGNNSGFTSSNPSAPEGAQVAFLQGGPANYISQSLSGFQAGVNYTVSFQAAQRGNFNTGGQDFDVYLDSTLLATFRPASTSYALLSTPYFSTTAGTHTLKFVGRDSAGGNANAAFIDAVQVTGSVVIPNSGFEAPAVGAGSFQYSPTGGNWTFGGGTGISANGSDFTFGNPGAPEGSQVAFIQFGSDDVFSQSLSGFQTGVSYTVSFAAAQRGNSSNGGQDFDVYLDTTLLGTFRPASTSYSTLSTAPFTTTAGTHTLKFVGRDSAGGNNTAFIDTVQITGTVAIADAGTVTVLVNGANYSTSFGTGDTPATIASRLATTINAGSYASATASGGTVNLTSKTAGTLGDYSLTASTTWNNSQFTNPSFTTSTSGATLTGGVNGVPAVTDSGTVTVKIGSTFTATACYGPSGSCTVPSGCPTGDSTSAQLACFLVSPGNTSGLNRAGSPVSASVPAGSGVIGIQAAASGTSTNYSLSNSSTFNTASFSGASFSAGLSGPTMTGGKDAVTNLVYDSGTVKVSVGNYTASVPYGQIQVPGNISWSTQDLTTLTGGAQASFGGPSSFAGDAVSPQHVFFADANKHVHEQWLDSAAKWHDQDVTSASGSSVTTTCGVVTSFALPGSSSLEHVFFVDASQHIREQYTDATGQWHNRDITAISGAATTPWGCGVSGFSTPNSSSPEHLVYIDANGHVHEVWVDSTGNWHERDNTITYGTPAVAHNTNPVFFTGSTSAPEHLLYVDANQHIREQYSDSGGLWHDQDLTTAAGGTNVKTGATFVAAFFDTFGSEHVFYQGSDLDIHRIWKDSAGWHDEDALALAGASGLFIGSGASVPSSLVAFQGLNGSKHLYYAANGNVQTDIYHLWNDSNGWHQEDLFTRFFAAASLSAFFDGANPQVFVVGQDVLHLSTSQAAPTNQLVNSTADQIVSALINDPITGLNVATSPVDASLLSGTTITLRARQGGQLSNVAQSASSVYDTADFAIPSFSESLSGFTLTGGADGITAPLYDSGTLSVNINNHVNLITWGEGATPQSMASALAADINQDPGASVTAGAQGNIVTFTARVPGANTNYTYVPNMIHNLVDFPQPSFTFQPSATPAPTLQGGSGGVFDTGTITVTVNGHSTSISYGQNDSADVGDLGGTLIDRLVSAINSDVNSPVYACCDPLAIKAKKPGSSSNYPFTVTSVTNNSSFTGTSFPVTVSGAALSGGLDTGGTFTDSGVVTLSVGSFTASTAYGPNDPFNLICCSLDLMPPSTASGIAAALVQAINQAPSAPVIAAISSNNSQTVVQISLIAKNGGSATNYSLTSSQVSNDPAHFPNTSFIMGPTNSVLAGGADRPNPSAASSSIATLIFGLGTTVSSSPTPGCGINLTVNGTIYAPCVTTSTPGPADFASAVANTINNTLNSPVTATASGSSVVITSVSAGASTIYPIAASVSGGPIGVAMSGPALSGGADGVAGGSNRFVYALDVGTDPSGTVFEANDSVNGNWTYFYDNLNRIQQASTSTVSYTYDYDRYGNRLHQTPLNGGNALSLVYLNNQISATGVTYDASGNMTSDGNHTYNYDAENRLVSVDNGQTATYTYNANGRRIRSNANGTSIDFVYDPAGQAVGVLRSDGTLIRQDIGGLATYSDAAYFQHRDWLGNLRVVTDQTGSIRQTCTNLPYGDGLTCTSAGITPTHFTGYTRDTETNLDYANARYYTSQFGRFTSADPLGGSISDPQSLNAYAYVGNGPLSATDSSGMAIDNPIGDLWLIYSGTSAGNGGLATWSFSTGPFNFSFAQSALQPGTGVGGSLALCGIIAGCGGSFDKGPPPPSAAQLRNEAAFANSLGPQGPNPLMMPGVVYGNLHTLQDSMQRNWIGGCPLSTCHTYNGLFPPLYPLMVGRGAASFPGTQALLMGAGPMITALTAPAFTVEEVLANPNLLRGWGPEPVEAEIGTTPGWRVEGLGKGEKVGQGWLLREYLSNGQGSGRMIRWHPGGSRHYATPHWTVTQPNVPTARVPGGY
jgi:RHS repeat-associated protein